MMELSLRPVAGEKRGEFRFGFVIWEGGNRVVRIMQEAGLFFLLFFINTPLSRRFWENVHTNGILVFWDTPPPSLAP